MVKALSYLFLGYVERFVKFFGVILFIGSTSLAQDKSEPKLIVGIVVDQMRFEYLYRFGNNYSERGFKRLTREGFNNKNVHYNYEPTATGPGHASIFTGTTPSRHGIVSNYWYNRKKKSIIYCVEDQKELPVGGIVRFGINIKTNSCSPKNLLVNTITDQIKLFFNGRSKVVGISLKDRGAIIPAGHMADYAFWYDGDSGHFVTSTYYNNSLPLWLRRFNDRALADSLLNLTWNPRLPIRAYKNSNLDDASFEKIYDGKTSSTFPYRLNKLRKKNGRLSLLTEIPHGNTLLTDMAIATIEGEELGQNEVMDFLTISYSSTDYVGHNFGIRSKELEDTYIRLDSEISRLLDFLDEKIGKDKYLLFLTADHAASDSPSFLEKKKLPSGFFFPDNIRYSTEEHLTEKFGPGKYIVFADATQIYLEKNINKKEEILRETSLFLSQIEGMEKVYIPALGNNKINNQMDVFLKNSYFTKRSGDIFLRFRPGWMPFRKYGTTHGNVYNDDTHVPLLWFGWKIGKGESVFYHDINQIAPTLSMLLNIPFPNASSNKPLLEIFQINN